MKIYGIIMSLCITMAIYAHAADSAAGGQGPGTTDYVVMESGTMMVVRDGVKRMMDADITMSDGTVIKKTGSYTQNGSARTMQEGDKMDMNGTLIRDTKTLNTQPFF
jgi:hypothetical protein